MILLAEFSEQTLLKIPATSVRLNINVAPRIIWYVNDDAPPSGNGLSWATAFRHPQDGVDVASSGDQIWIAEGIYLNNPPSSVPILDMKSGVEVYGGFVGTETSLAQRGDPALNPTVLDGEDLSYHVVLGNSYATLDGFTVQNGEAFPHIGCYFVSPGIYPDCDGGGMNNSNISYLEINNCIFTNNSGFFGSAMANLDSTSISIENCTFSVNDALPGMGPIGPFFTILNDNSASAVISNCIFSDNSGNGMINYDSSPTISNCVFTYNDVLSNYGGGIHNDNSSSYISNCLFTYNVSLRGGGIFNKVSSPVISNCTFYGNTAYYWGFYYGGTICNWSSSDPVIMNSILWGNIVPPIGGQEIYNNDASSNPIVTYSDIEGGYPGIGNINSDPLFVTGPMSDFYLSHIATGDPSDSPCVDAGSAPASSVGIGRQNHPHGWCARLGDGGYGIPLLIELFAKRLHVTPPSLAANGGRTAGVPAGKL